MRKRNLKSKRDELLKKSREAMLAAVQIYNNPQITFKTETFITLAIISWTYLMHAYFRGKGIDYRYFDTIGKKKKYSKTKNGAFKHWELERCLNDDQCPLDRDTRTNLYFLIGLRHEIEHQMTNKIDEFISAKLQACALNYSLYINKLFGSKYNIEKELTMSIQFSPISPEQQQGLKGIDALVENVRNYIASFESTLDDNELASPKYAYRVLFVPINAKRPGQADKVIEFVKSDSPLAAGLEKQYTIIKETEKRKYLPSEIVKIMNDEGYPKFSMQKHTELWKAQKAKENGKQYGIVVAKTWYWYENWLLVVKNHCAMSGDLYR